MAWRIGVVPYLNADPLAAALREPNAAELVGGEIDYRALVPSQLLQSLLAGELDTALVSVGGILPHPELRILPAGCVSARGTVTSIVLYCRCPAAEARTVALDASSRSGEALTRVLFAERWKTSPEYVTMPPVLDQMLEHADAGLLIGNPSLQANLALRHGEYPGLVAEQHDLGAEWLATTGYPFVYAVWAVPSSQTPEQSAELTALLDRALAWGKAHRPLLAERGAAELGLSVPACEEYITNIIRYDLGSDERAGMQRFCDLGVQHGVLPPTSAVRFTDPGED